MVSTIFMVKEIVYFLVELLQALFVIIFGLVADFLVLLVVARYLRVLMK
jgi:hypothetical protein